MNSKNISHSVFNFFHCPDFINHYKALRAKSDKMILIIVDHDVYDDFFWDMNNLLIDNLKHEYLKLGKQWNPIIPLPLNSSEDEFVMLLEKMENKGTILMDSSTMFRLNFEDKNPLYFFCERLFIHNSGEISILSNRKF